MATTSSTYAQLVFYFVIWYACNATYNIYNQKVKSEFNFAFATSSLQLFVGLLYVIPLWLLGLRKRPSLSVAAGDLKVIFPIVLLNTLGHITSVVAMFEKGGGTLTHVVKASEPIVSVFLAFAFDRKVPGVGTFLSLLLIAYGVAFASTKGDITWDTLKVELMGSKSASLAMIANIAFALRSLLRKKLINKEFIERTNLDPLNDHAVTTFFSLVIALLVTPMFEDVNEYLPNVDKLFFKSPINNNLLFNTLICGISWYLYNEYQNIVLSRLGPIPTAVGNALKRVAVFVAFHFFVPGEEISNMKALGCAVAVTGCFFYALCDFKGL